MPVKTPAGDSGLAGLVVFARRARPARIRAGEPTERRANMTRLRDAELPQKPCATCGRAIVWRQRLARDWEQVRYCSDGCRGGLDGIDRALEVALQQLLAARARDASICPSEAARAVAADWRPLLERARRAARRLVAAGLVEVTQGGVVVDPSTAKGPIRVRRSR